MYRVTRLNAVSWAKASTVAWLVIVSVVSLLFLLPFMMFAALAALSGEDSAAFLLVIPVVFGIGLAGLLALGLMVFIISLVQAAAFSWALGRTGGLEVDLAIGPRYQVAAPESAPAEPVEAAAVAAAELPPPTEPVAALPPPAEELSPVEPEVDAAVLADLPPPQAADPVDDLPPGGA